MTYDQAEKHFGSQGALARAFDPPLRQSTVSDWKQNGGIPRGRQFELQVITGGMLKADENERHIRRPSWHVVVKLPIEEHLSEEHLKAIGLVVAEWSTIERSFLYILCGLVVPNAKQYSDYGGQR